MPVLSGVKIQVGVESHTGKVREENQDRVTQFTSPFGEVFIVADGMGGHLGGATAATTVVQGMQASLTALPECVPVADALSEACRRVNADVYRQGNSGEPAVSGMGSTIVIAVLTMQGLVVGHVGDSRAYLFRDGCLQQITRDHTRVQQYVDAHLMSEAEARNHPESSFLTRAIGQKQEVEIEVQQPIPLRFGDGILLCSDGLSGYIDNPAIEASIRNHAANAKAVVSDLIRLALEAGGEDNVTVQFILPMQPMVLSPPVKTAGPMASPSRKPAILAVALAVVAVLAVAALQPWKGPDKGPAQPAQKGPLVLTIGSPAPISTPSPVMPAPPTGTSQAVTPRENVQPAAPGSGSTPAAPLPAPSPFPVPGDPPVVPPPISSSPMRRVPSVIVLYGHDTSKSRHSEAAAKLKEKISSFLGEQGVKIEVLKEQPDTHALLMMDSVIFMKPDNPYRQTVQRIANAFGWRIRKPKPAATSLLSSADVVVIVGSNEK